MPRVPCIAAFFSAIIACFAARSVAAAEAQSAVQVSDSADVRIISLGRVEELSPPELTADLVFSTRELGIELFRVGDAVLLGNGGLALANTGDTEILLLAEDGSLVRRVGGRGEGPGEFGIITALLAADAGFLTYDTRLGRLSSFSETGEFLTSSRLSPPNAIVDLNPLAHDAAGNMLAILGVQRHFQPSGMKRDTAPLLSYTDPSTWIRRSWGPTKWSGAARPDAETRRWLVIGPDGQPRGWLDLPAQASVLAVDAERCVLLQSDALDVEEVRLYRYR